MRIGRQAARYYVTDEVIAKLAERMAAAVKGYTPPIDLDSWRRKRHRRAKRARLEVSRGPTAGRSRPRRMPLSGAEAKSSAGD